MNKVFMLVNYTPKDKSIGITKKISSQIKALRNLEYSVTYTSYEADGIAIYDNFDELLYFRKYTFKNKKLKGLYRYFDLLTTAAEYIKKSDESFDICYARINAINGLYLKVLRLLKSKGARIIIESIGYFPGIKMKSLKSRYIAESLKYNQNKLRKIVDLVLTEGWVDSFYGIPCRSVKIGVETDKLPIHRYDGSADELNLISVANERIYHGYDRLIKSLAEYDGDKKIHIHLVGVMFESTLNMIKELGLSDCVTCYGKQHGDALYDIYNKCNIGVGPLAQHRIGGKKDTGLKTKEYFGMGLPYFYAGEESDLPENYPYVFEVPSDESNINFDEIWNFYQDWKENSAVADEMRAFAQKTFSWETIMRDALS